MACGNFELCIMMKIATCLLLIGSSFLLDGHSFTVQCFTHLDNVLALGAQLNITITRASVHTLQTLQVASSK